MYSLIERFYQILGLGILVLLFAGCGGGGGGFSSGGQEQTTTTPAEPLNITTDSLEDGTVNQTYLQLLEVEGGTSDTVVQWVSQGQLPPGLKLDSSLGKISGIPTTAGTYPFLVQAQDTQNSSLNSAIKQFSITIDPAPTTALTPLSITTTSPLPDGTVNQSYLTLLTGEGGGSKSDFRWSVNSGQLPSGLQLTKVSASQSKIEGTPTQGGTFTFLIKLEDIVNPGLTPAINEFSITIQGGGGSTAQVKDIQLLASSPQLPSAGNSPVTLTSIVRDINNNTLKDIPVTFKADNDGTIQVTRGTTDASGSAVAQLSTFNNKNNRQIKVTAETSGLQNSVTIDVIGTTITISGPTSAALGDSVPLTLRLVDSSGNPIAYQPLTVSSANSNGISNPNPSTDTNGQAQPVINATIAGTDTITVTGAGARQQQSLSVSTDTLKFLSPNPAAGLTEIPLNTDYTVEVLWQQKGVPVADGQVINFTTTRGTITPTATTINGKASATLKAPSAGRAIITATAQGGSPSTQIEVLFVATEANKLTLQADPAALSVGQQSSIKAVVFDPAFNRVKGKKVNFTLTDTTGGTLSSASAVTNEFGEAFVTYTAGLVGSALNGVRIDAVVDGLPSVNDDVSLSVSQQLFVTLGTGNVIQEDSTKTRYKQPYNVLVTTGTGAPVGGVAVTLTIIPNTYSKGRYVWVSPVWRASINVTCRNEDENRNGFLDPGEDINGNNILDPGNVVTLEDPQGLTGTSVTIITSSTAGNVGFGFFNVVYAKQFANWINAALTARAVVAGTEATNVANYTLPILTDDINKETVSPPGQPSPFGESKTCTDTQ